MMKFLLSGFMVALMAPLIIVPHTVQVDALDIVNGTANNNTKESIADALETSKIILESIGNFIDETLMPEAYNDGVKILQDTKTYLANCETILKTIENIPEYYDCAKPELGKAMAALSALQSKYHLLQMQNMANNNNNNTAVTSGAATLKLFWL